MIPYFEGRVGPACGISSDRAPRTRTIRPLLKKHGQGGRVRIFPHVSTATRADRAARARPSSCGLDFYGPEKGGVRHPIARSIPKAARCFIRETIKAIDSIPDVGRPTGRRIYAGENAVCALVEKLPEKIRDRKVSGGDAGARFANLTARVGVPGTDGTP